MKYKSLLFLLLFLFTHTAWADDLEVCNQTLKKTSDGYSYSLEYPVSKGLPERANAESLAFVEKIANEFTKAYSEMLTDGGRPGGLAWDLEVEVLGTYANEALVAYDFGGYDFRGGAHGMPILETLLLSRKDGSLVKPENLFKNDKYLDILARFCRKEMAKREGFTAYDEWMLKGSAPETENYSVLSPSSKGITVTFGPYQVGSYAQGAQTILVPYGVLKSVLNPEFF